MRKQASDHSSFSQRLSIQRLLADGWTNRRIAAQLGVNETLVRRVAKHGGEYHKRPAMHARCSGCGGLQTAPCLVCARRLETTGRLAS